LSSNGLYILNTNTLVCIYYSDILSQSVAWGGSLPPSPPLNFGSVF
jgi:hypothetical protein